MSKKIYKPSLLFVFCNATLANTINNYFKTKEYTTEITYSCDDAQKKILSNKYKLVILEKPQTKKDSCIKLIESIRDRDSYIPIIVISENDSDVISIYKSGANLTHYKPLDIKLLEVQVEQLLYYRKGIYKIKMNDIEIDLKTREIRRKGKIINLTRNEFDFLTLLIISNGYVLKRETIKANLMDYNEYVQNGAVDTLICRTRNKLAEYGKTPVIETVVGSGYKLNNIYLKSCKFT
ncbi:MAG: response regulator transcription factor [Candidatus Dojkabacteria bacterium]|nr:response regulator transcription factor [Candidatus Dojkabacteria bacterium]